MNDSRERRPVRDIMPGISLRAGGATSIGSDPSCDAVKSHPLIAGRHLEIIRGNDRASIRDLGSGTFVNGRRILGREIDLQINDEIDLGPYALRFTGTHLESLSSRNQQVQLSAINLNRTVESRGQRKPLLQNVSLVILPGEFVCFLGPTGCGKSTLMKALSGRESPSDGKVYVNQHELYEHFEMLKQSISYVPQEGTLHAELSVEESLRYTASLRLLKGAGRHGRVDQMIETMELERARHTLFGDASGGQKKRACLANELISDPGLIFLDEVTSGLDERTDGEMMTLFRSLADQGKTVACITHSLVHVASHCDLVVVLTPGGRMAYVGPPADALEYFQVKRLGDVYGLFGKTEEEQERLAQSYASRFRESDQCETYVDGRLPEPTSLTDQTRPKRGPTIRLRAEGEIATRQTFCLLLRQLHVLRRDLPTCFSLLGQILLVAVILGLAFGTIGKFPAASFEDELYTSAKWRDSEDGNSKDDSSKDDSSKDDSSGDGGSQESSASGGDKKEESENLAFSPERIDYVRKILNMMFLLGVTSFWFGCNNAAKEIVRERCITTQELSFNLRPLAYYSSKLTVLTLISCVQAGLLLFIVWYWCHPPVNALSLLPTLLALAAAGTSWGLFISTLSRNEPMAVTLIPIIVIPQIILSGAIVKLDGMSRTLAQLLVTTYWGKRGLDVALGGDPGKFARQGSSELITGNTMLFPISIVFVHAIVLAVITLAALASDNTLRGAIGKLKGWLPMMRSSTRV